jgi:hypothetical protein
MELNNMKKIINTPEGIIEIDLTSEEIAQRQIDAQKELEKKQAKEQVLIAYEAEQEAKEIAKASALAKLSALGLTEEEVKSIL